MVKGTCQAVFVGTEEDLDGAAERILEDHTGLRNIYMDQYYTFGKVDRFPLRRVISVAYFALIRGGGLDSSFKSASSCI